MPAPTASPAANKADAVANYVKERGGNKVIRKVRSAFGSAFGFGLWWRYLRAVHVFWGVGGLI